MLHFPGTTLHNRRMKSDRECNKFSKQTSCYLRLKILTQVINFTTALQYLKN